MTLVFQRVVLPQTMLVERGLKVDPMGRLFKEGALYLPAAVAVCRVAGVLHNIPRLHKSWSNSGGHRSWASSSV
jgi:hypothetical protein